ncbi:MAG TPA: hypothetical protein VF263_08475 [Longimicrobiaceae bacterium]
MSRRTTLLLLCVPLGALAAAYAALSGFARRPLSPPEFGIFAAAVLRATPAYLGDNDPVETLRLGGAAFGSPADTVVLTAEGRTYAVGLPPRTTRAESTHPPARRFVTFATAEELHEYLRSTLPRAGWSYREQLGSMHAFERGDLLLSVQSRFHAGTRVRALSIGLRTRAAGR